jgi:L-ribulose-5-phosphate 3-epimerase
MRRRDFIKQTSSAALLATLLPEASLLGANRFNNEIQSHICIFSKHLQWLDYGDMARLAAKIRFSGIDLTVRKGGHVLPENVRTDLPEAVEQVRAAGIEVPMISTYITDPDDSYTRDILETAGKLGIKLYRTGWFRYNNGEKVKTQLSNARRQMTGLQDMNKAFNIASSYQNHSGTYIGSSGWDLLEIIEGLDPQWTGVQFDIRHAMVEGPETWPYILELLAPYINSVDIKDFTWEVADKAKVVNVPLGKGLVDFDLFLTKLHEFQLSPDFSIHYEYPLGGAEHGAAELGISKEEFIKQVGADLNFFKTLQA